MFDNNVNLKAYYIFFFLLCDNFLSIFIARRHDVRLSKVYYCAVSESLRTTKNWIDHTRFKSEQKNKYGRPYYDKIGTIMKIGIPYSIKVGNSF